jgi:hypothetical protein
MKKERDMAFAGLASATPTLFRPETKVAGRMPRYAEATSAAQRELFERLIDRTRILSDGIWFGTPHDLAHEWQSKELAAKMPQMKHEHLVLYGKLDYWATPAEILLRGSGDCEDFAILKMTALIRAGLPGNTLSLVVVRDNGRGVFHAVLAVTVKEEN